MKAQKADNREAQHSLSALLKGSSMDLTPSSTSCPQPRQDLLARKRLRTDDTWHTNKNVNKIKLNIILLTNKNKNLNN
eukprot:7266102-Ditylum_brightwellii.AAC.1